MPKTFDLRYEVTERGFARWEFTDRYGEKCSIQDSPLATENAIWLGINRVAKYAMGRMYLTQQQAKELVPLLQYFAEHGSLPDQKPVPNFKPGDAVEVRLDAVADRPEQWDPAWIEEVPCSHGYLVHWDVPKGSDWEGVFWASADRVRARKEG